MRHDGDDCVLHKDLSSTCDQTGVGGNSGVISTKTHPLNNLVSDKPASVSAPR